MSNYVDFVDGDFIASGTTLDDIYIALIIIIIMLGIIAGGADLPPPQKVGVEMYLLSFGFYGIMFGFALSGVVWLLGLVFTSCYSAIFKHND